MPPILHAANRPGRKTASILALHLVIVMCLAAAPALAGDCTAAALQGNWRVTTLAQDSLPDGATIRFETASRVAADLGCNKMTGGYTLAHGVLRSGAMAMTRMACPAPLMTRDHALAALLASGAACRITADGDLHLGPEATPDLTATR